MLQLQHVCSHRQSYIQSVPQLVSLQQNQEKTGPVVLLQHKHFSTSLLSADGHLIGIHRSEAKS